MSSYRSLMAIPLLLALSIAISLSTGLSLAGRSKITAPEDFGIPRLDEFNKVYVKIEATPEIASHEKFKNTAISLSDNMVGRLNGHGIFEEVSADEPDELSETDLRLALKVIEFKYTGMGGRMVGGIMAGKAKLGMEVSLTAGGSGETVASFTLSATSKKIHGVTASNTVNQVWELTERIAQEIAKEKAPEEPAE